MILLDKIAKHSNSIVLSNFNYLGDKLTLLGSTSSYFSLKTFTDVILTEDIVSKVNILNSSLKNNSYSFSLSLVLNNLVSNE